MIEIINGKIIAELNFDSLEQMKNVMLSLANRFEFVGIDLEKKKLRLCVGDAE